MGLPDPDRASSWGGKTIVDRSGALIGPCVQVYRDDATGLPEWATARIGSVRVLLPLLDAVEDGDQVRVGVGRDEALLAPAVADAQHLTPDDEARLYRHYGIEYSTDRSATVLPAETGPQPPPSGPTGPRALRRLVVPDVLADRRRAVALAGVIGVLAVLAAGLTALARRRRPAPVAPPPPAGLRPACRTGSGSGAVSPPGRGGPRARRGG